MLTNVVPVPGRIEADTEVARMAAFNALDAEQKRAAIVRLSVSGMSDHGIARATGLSVEMVFRVLSEQPAGNRSDRNSKE